MRREYKQVKYRADQGRFDGNLNSMAERGWEVVSIDRLDDLFLVTFSRQVEQRVHWVICEKDRIDEQLRRHRGDRLLHMQADRTLSVCLLAWETS